MKSSSDIDESISGKKDTKSFRERPHRISSLPVKDVLQTRMFELGIKNIDLQHHLGLPSPNVISMMKKGTMRLPIQYATKVANYLEIDKMAFLRKVVEENDPTLWDAVQEATGSLVSLSENEAKFLKVVRAELDGFDTDLFNNEFFYSGFKQLLAHVLRQELEKKIEIAKSRFDVSIPPSETKRGRPPLDV